MEIVLYLNKEVPIIDTLVNLKQYKGAIFIMRIISLINKKGGVGKTTITINLAYALAEMYGIRVLVLDNDDQGNDSQFFNATTTKSLADLLTDKAKITEVIQHTRYPNIDIIPSDEQLLDANVDIIKNESIVQQNILQDALNQVADQYDICLIDNPPHIDISVVNSLVASDDVIIVTTPDLYGMRGVEQMVAYIESIQAYNPKLILRGCLLNKFSSTPHGYRYINELETKCPVFKSRIRYTKDKLEASAQERMAIYEYSAGCGFARDLLKFINELTEA